jgi:hypothetical protein
MAKKFKVTIRILQQNQKLQTRSIKKAQVVFHAERVVGVVELPGPHGSEMDTPTQLLTDAGPFDVFEDPAEVLKRIEQASE